MLKVKQLITESRVDFISRKVDYNTEIKRNEAPDIIDQFSHHIETSHLLLCKSTDWFLYDGNIGRERVNTSDYNKRHKDKYRTQSNVYDAAF